MRTLRSLTYDDHRILLTLIQGGTVVGLAQEMGVPHTTLESRVRSMRTYMECKTVFQLVALEVVYLMSAEESPILNKLLDIEPEPITLAATA